MPHCGMLRLMAARNRPPRRHASNLGVTDVVRKHMALSRKREVLMRRVAELRDAGKIDEALQLMKRTEAVHERITALESKMRPFNPYD